MIATGAYMETPLQLSIPDLIFNLRYFAPASHGDFINEETVQRSPRDADRPEEKLCGCV
jgi:hypothetical protein